MRESYIPRLALDTTFLIGICARRDGCVWVRMYDRWCLGAHGVELLSHEYAIGFSRMYEIAWAYLIWDRTNLYDKLSRIGSND